MFITKALQENTARELQDNAVQVGTSFKMGYAAPFFFYFFLNQQRVTNDLLRKSMDV